MIARILHPSAAKLRGFTNCGASRFALALHDFHKEVEIAIRKQDSLVPRQDLLGAFEHGGLGKLGQRLLRHLGGALNLPLLVRGHADVDLTALTPTYPRPVS